MAWLPYPSVSKFMNLRRQGVKSAHIKNFHQVLPAHTALGFSPNMIKYDATGNKEQQCGETLFEDSGSFTSPGYPENYPANTKCEWNIVAQRDRPYVRLNVTDMKFDARSSGCFIQG